MVNERRGLDGRDLKEEVRRGASTVGASVPNSAEVVPFAGRPSDSSQLGRGEGGGVKKTEGPGGHVVSEPGCWGSCSRGVRAGGLWAGRPGGLTSPSVTRSSK